MTPISDAGSPETDSPLAKGPLPTQATSIVRTDDPRTSNPSSPTPLQRRDAASSSPALLSSTQGLRSLSPSINLSASRVLSRSVFGTPSVSSEDGSQDQTYGDEAEGIRNFIARGFAPTVAVSASHDTDELLREKGFPRGLWQILRPFGDKVTGKVVVRDSVGASRVYEDFTVRFVKSAAEWEQNDQVPNSVMAASVTGQKTGTSSIDGIEEVLNVHLKRVEHFADNDYSGTASNEEGQLPSAGMSPFHSTYLRKLLAATPLVPHETFAHPVACVIAISSRNPAPIEELRRLYSETASGKRRLPPWVNGEYLRYYVLVHDEEKDDIGKSMTLFDQMKRHFGLHCHLLRLRSSQCVPTDDDSVMLPTTEWMTAAEELEALNAEEEQDLVESTAPCIFDSDAVAINAFIREMTTQSVVPFMERSVTTWNDQVASRRRGIGGRFMNLSKRFNVFGSSSRASGSSVTATNYDSSTGIYNPEAPEAIMRKLADYAFMLRDFKLAQGVYDMLRTDFNSDKAWRYYAATNEMAAISTLMLPQTLSARSRTENIDPMLEAAVYSYLTRCDAPYSALRCLGLSIELLRVRGGTTSDDAARWTCKLLESSVVGDIGNALWKERVAACFTTKHATRRKYGGGRRRKAALWNILAADQWLTLGKCLQAARCLQWANDFYNEDSRPVGVEKFHAARDYLQGLAAEIDRERYGESAGGDDGLVEDVVSDMQEVL